MIHETKNIEIDYAALGLSHDETSAIYTTYLHDTYPTDQNIIPRPLIVVCPGGGYHHHSKREGEPIALKMLSLGYNAVILRYSLMPNEFPCALYELATLVAYARKNAAEWNIDPGKIVLAGFSAGAHLCASLGTMWTNQELFAPLGLTPEEIRPNKMLLGYPVITSGEFAHQMSFVRLLGSRYETERDSQSLELLVSKDTPECFLWHTCIDDSVPLENTLLFANALRRAGILFELHVFPFGSHGMALATEETNDKAGTKVFPECAVWPELFATWLSKTKFD